MNMHHLSTVGIFSFFVGIQWANVFSSGPWKRKTAKTLRSLFGIQR